MLNVNIQDGLGRGTTARIEDRALLVSQYPSPPLVSQKVNAFGGYLLNSSDSEDLLVDGSTTPVDFYVEADDEKDRYITGMNFVMAYPSASAIFAEFADDAAALTNGCTLTYETAGSVITINDDLKVNGDFMRLSLNPNLTETRSMLAVNDYGWSVSVAVKDYMPPYGLKLDRGTKQRLIFKIQDDLTASNATLFNCTYYGFERFE